MFPFLNLFLYVNVIKSTIYFRVDFPLSGGYVVRYGKFVSKVFDIGRLTSVGKHSMKLFSSICVPVCLSVCPSVTKISQDRIISFSGIVHDDS